MEKQIVYIKDRLDDKIEYLQMIQEPISRMSTVSAIFKGFSATVVAGIATFAYNEINILILILSFLPVVAFNALDIYYLQMEKKYRYLYEQVRTDKHIVDFAINIDFNDEEQKNAKATLCDCMKSPSIFLFYPMIFVILAIVVILKMNNFL